MAQKLITVNINVYEQTVVNRHSVYEIKDVNKFLDEGWVVKECIQGTTTSSNWINLTFLLEKL
jgi:hypothetical protein